MTQPDEPVVNFFITPDIWPIVSVADCPEVTLSQWKVLEVQLPQNPGRTRHFVGYPAEGRAGQVSSAVQQFDPKTMRGVTASGRVYQLSGPPGRNADARHTWRRWASMGRAAQALDVTASMKSSQENAQ